MRLPPPNRGFDIPTPVLPRRREAIDDPNAAWEVLDEFHRLPGVRGSVVATRSGRIVLCDVVNENDRAPLETIARHIAKRFRDDVGRLAMGPLRQATIQTSRRTVISAPTGPGMLVSLSEASVAVAHLRQRMERVQDELGRVELTAIAGRSAPARRPATAVEIHPGVPIPGDGATERAASPVPPSAWELPPLSISSASPPEIVAIDEIQPTEIVDERGVIMIFIPGGTFHLGSNDGEDESPPHPVTLSPFLIDKYPVTNEAYGAFVEAIPGWRSDATNFLLDDDYLAHWTSGHLPGAISQHPVVWVSWWQAMKGYCAWRGGRLPTEAEWEFAGRGTDGRVFPWGSHWRTRRCNAYKLGAHWTSPVGEFPEGRSPFGVMDLSGNVWEWCFDWYAPDWYRRSPRENPTGPTYGRGRAIRGGSRFNHADFVKLTKRLFFPPQRSDVSIGFRCVKPWPPPPIAERGSP